MAGIWRLIRRTFKIWNDNNAMRMAAGVAFYTMMSIAPLLVVLLNILTLKYGRAAEAKLNAGFDSFVGSGQSATPGGAIHELLHTAFKSHNGSLASVLGVGIALVSGSTLFVSVHDSLNAIWGVRTRAGGGILLVIRERVVAGTMVLAAMALLLASFVLSAGLSVITARLGSFHLWLSYVGDIGVSFLISSIMFALIYRFLPDVKVKWSDVRLGAVITALLFILGKFGLTIYFRLAAMGDAYGAAGSLAALLLWVYYSAALFFFGAAFTRVHAEYKGDEIEPENHAVRVREYDDDGDLMSHVPPPRPNAPARAGRGWTSLGIAALIGSIAALIFTSEDRRLRAQIAHLRIRKRLEAIEKAGAIARS